MPKFGNQKFMIPAERIEIAEFARGKHAIPIRNTPPARGNREL
jgi:hypothetical protein